jgi:hypothetical protein
MCCTQQEHHEKGPEQPHGHNAHSYRENLESGDIEVTCCAIDDILANVVTEPLVMAMLKTLSNTITLCMSGKAEC